MPATPFLGYSRKPMSIRQNPHPSGSPLLPDFANLGVWLRVLLGVNALALLGALAANRQWSALPDELARLAAIVEPSLIATLLVLRLLHRLLLHLPALAAGILTLCISLFCTILGLALAGWQDDSFRALLPRAMLWAAFSCAALLLYFDHRARQQQPALTEARLAALTARIRPHFLFNSLNAVLGVIRSDPRRAETALEELSDLFRVLMRDNRELVPLSEEIALARQYLSIERLRLGERLQVKWQIDAMPPDALLPPLMLQPMRDNAVYHGVEPLGDAGEITITLARVDEELQIEIGNPCPVCDSGKRKNTAGNQMALANIRERLALFFDLEARLEARADPEGGRYDIRIVIPYRRATK